MNLKHPTPRQAISVRIDPALWRDVLTFVRDEAGAPHYQRTGTFVEAALRAHLEHMRRRAADDRRS